MKISVRVQALILMFFFSLYVNGQSTVHTLVLSPGPANGMDSDIRTDLPSTPRGTSYDFMANAWTAQGNFFIERGLIKFDLAQIPPDAEVIDATLFLYTNLTTGHYQLDSGANASWLLRVLEPWQENQVCWDNQPSISMLNPVILPQSVSNTQNYEVDVTSHVTDMFQNPANNHGWMIRLQTEETYRCLVFASSDHQTEAWRPKLIVRYKTCQLPIAGFTYTTTEQVVQFTDESSLADAWHWTFGDGSTSDEQNPEHYYSHPGTYQVCLEISDSCGTSLHCDTLEITCDLPEAGFDYDYTYLSVKFTDTSNCPHPVSWLWDFGDSTTSTLQNPGHVYLQYGIYQVCLTITDSCSSDSQCEQVFILDAFKPVFTFEQNPGNDLTVHFQNKTEGAKWWSWDFGDGGTSTEQNPVHTYNTSGNFNVCLTAGTQSVNNTGCSLVEVKKINMEANGRNIVFYPNPCPGESKLQFVIFENTAEVHITVYDINGKMTLMRTYYDVRKNEPVIFDVEGLPSGIYLFTCAYSNFVQNIKIALQ